MDDLKKLLTEGLVSGYAGSTEIKSIDRGNFTIQSSEYKTSDGDYIDQWIDGGGQELASINGNKATRVYAGGTIPEERLIELGITQKDVIGFLIKTIQELKDKTRLDENCSPEPDGDYQYSYKVIDHLEYIDLTIALEEIKYKGTRVFAHGFLHSPVR